MIALNMNHVVGLGVLIYVTVSAIVGCCAVGPCLVTVVMSPGATMNTKHRNKEMG